MAQICTKCNKDVTDPAIECGGFCNERCHEVCIGLPADHFERSIIWMCSPCKLLIKNSSMKKFLSAQQDVMQIIKSEVESCAKSMSSVVQENTSKICENAAKIEQLSALLHDKPKVNLGRLTSERTPKRSRQSFEQTAIQPTYTGSKCGNDFGVATVPRPTSTQGKFWLYITRISPNVNENMMSEMVKSCLDTSDIVVQKVIPKNRIASNLPITFISFKIGVDPNLRKRALESSTWPSGIQFREFVNVNLPGNDSEPEVKRTNSFFVKPSTLDRWIISSTHANKDK